MHYKVQQNWIFIITIYLSMSKANNLLAFLNKPTKNVYPRDNNDNQFYGGSYQDVNAVSYQQNFQNNPGQMQGGINSNGQYYQNNQVQYNTQTRDLRLASKGSITSTKSIGYENSFQEARVETAQRLEGIAMKIKREIDRLNLKIQVFGSQMNQFASIEFNNVKQRIHQIVEETLLNSGDYVREFIHFQQTKFTGQIYQARYDLQLLINDIESMRNDISKEYWRGTAGVFITREFEAKVEAAIKGCQYIHLKQVDQQANINEIKEMGRQLYDNVRQVLTRQREKIYGF